MQGAPRYVDIARMPADAFLTRGQVAALSGFHPQTLLLWASKGRGPTVTPVEGRMRYRVAEVRRWLALDDTMVA